MDQDRKEARQAAKNMSPKEKWNYFWEYYKIQTFIGAAVVLILITVIGSFTFNKAPEPCIQIGFRSDQLDLDQIDELPDQLSAAYPELTKNGEEIFTAAEFYAGYRDEQAQENQATLLKFSGSIAAGTLDIVIGDEKTMRDDAVRGVYQDLRNIFTAEELEKLAALSEARAAEGREGILYVSYDKVTVNGKVEDRVENVPYYICIAGGSEAIDQCLLGKSAYVGIVSNAANMDNVKAFIWSLLGENAD